MKTTMLALAAATAFASAVPVSSALADPPPWSHAGGNGHGRGEYRNHVYDTRGRYVEPRRITRDSRVWRGRDGRYYCKRDNGTTGLIIGAGVGALAGHQIAGNGDRTLGAILGGVVGGALGREIDRGGLKCR